MEKIWTAAGSAAARAFSKIRETTRPIAVSPLRSATGFHNQLKTLSCFSWFTTVAKYSKYLYLLQPTNKV
jgi:hypothetical protein